MSCQSNHAGWKSKFLEESGSMWEGNIMKCHPRGFIEISAAALIFFCLVSVAAESTNADQPKAHRAKPAQFFDLTQPSYNAMTLFGKTIRLPPTSEGRRYFSLVQPLPLERPATTALVMLNGKFKFKIFDPLAQTARINLNQTLQLEGVSTRAWTSIVGWHPGESAFPDACNYEPQFNLFCIGGEPQR